MRESKLANIAVSCQEDTATVQLAGDDAAGQIVAE